jgi:hypothetical protein
MKNGIILHNLDTFFQGKHEYIDLKLSHIDKKTTKSILGKHEYIDLKLSHIDKKTTKSIFLHHFCI